MEIVTLVTPSGERCCLPWERCKSWQAVEPLIAAYIRNREHRQHFSDGLFTLTNSTGLTISPLVWPVGVVPGSDVFLRITSDLDNGVNGAYSQMQPIQDHVDQACSRIAERVDEALLRLVEVDQQISAFRRTVHESMEAHHQDQISQHTQTERVREAQWDARDRERELEKDRRDRERESEKDRRQREREHTQDVRQGGRPLITSPQDPARSRSADTAMATDLRALTDQVREIATTLQRASGEGIALAQSVIVCRRRRLRCLRFFACKTPL